MDKTFLKVTYLSIFLSTFFYLIYLTIEGSLSDIVYDIYSKPLYAYSILLFILSSIFLYIIVCKNKTYTPSIILYLSFLAVPLFGSIGHRIHVDLFGYSFYGVISFEFPVFVWSVGTTALFAGILFSQLFTRLPKRNLTHLWDFKRTSFLLWLFLFVSLTCTVIALFRIGYIPVLHSGIDAVRINYPDVAGRYPYKFSRLFIITSLLSMVLFFLNNHNKLFLYVFLLSLFGLSIYGQRMMVFLPIFSFLLIYVKFHKPNIVRFIIMGFFFCCLVIIFLIAQEYRGGHLHNGVKVRENILLPLFAEWSSYSHVTNEIRRGEHYLKEDIFLGPLTMIFPRQIWALFGIDKDSVIKEHSALYYYGEQFDDELGIRITPIGEAYASYGIFYGVCLQMFIFGVIFGVLEKMYLNLNKLDSRLCILCFLISLFMFLPISTLKIYLDRGVYFGSILLLCMLVGTNRCFSRTPE